MLLWFRSRFKHILQCLSPFKGLLWAKNFGKILKLIPKLNCHGIPLPILCSGVSYETKLLGAAFLSTARHLRRAQGRFTMPFMPYMRFEENASFWLLPHLSGYCLNGVELEKLTILANYYFKIPKFSPAAPQSSEDVRRKILRWS